MGAGEINPIEALYPGVLYETTTKDYCFCIVMLTAKANHNDQCRRETLLARNLVQKTHI